MTVPCVNDVSEKYFDSTFKVESESLKYVENISHLLNLGFEYDVFVTSSRHW